MGLQNRVFSAVRWTMLSAAVRGILQVVQLIVLARLLTPLDYGLLAMVGVVLTFPGLFADMGINSAFVQRKDVSADARTSLFWLNVGLSCLLTLILVACSPWIAAFFGDKRLVPLLMLASSTFIITAVGQQLRMAAEKALQFDKLVKIELVASLVAFAVAVTTANLGWGVYSLVVGAISSALLSSVAAWIWLDDGWRPTCHYRHAEVRGFVDFGSALVVGNLANQINSSVDIFLGGRLLSAAGLGIYSVPRNLVLQLQLLINPIVTRVGFPMIAKMQHDLTVVRMIYGKTLNMTASFNAPIYIGIAVYAESIVMIMLGPKWTESAELLRILALWGGLRSIANPIGSLLLGMGRATLAMKWNLALIFMTAPIVWIGAKWGPAGMAYAMLFLMCATFLPAWALMIRPLCGMRLATYSAAALMPFLLAVIAIWPASLLLKDVESPFLHLCYAFIISLPLYVLLSLVFNKDWLVSIKKLAAGDVR